MGLSGIIFSISLIIVITIVTKIALSMKVPLMNDTTYKDAFLYPYNGDVEEFIMLRIFHLMHDKYDPSSMEHTLVDGDDNEISESIALVMAEMLSKYIEKYKITYGKLDVSGIAEGDCSFSFNRKDGKVVKFMFPQRNSTVDMKDLNSYSDIDDVVVRNNTALMIAIYDDKEKASHPVSPGVVTTVIPLDIFNRNEEGLISNLNENFIPMVKECVLNINNIGSDNNYDFSHIKKEFKEYYILTLEAKVKVLENRAAKKK